MRYTLLTFLACPECQGDLATIILKERKAPAAFRNRHPTARVAAEGALVAPLGPAAAPTEIARLLQRHAGPPAPEARDFEVEVEDGLLVCVSCARWFPVHRLLPELLPDHLRDWARDGRLLDGCADRLPADLRGALRAHPGAAAPQDDGADYKRAEIGISARVDDPHFFSPGYSSPFNPHNTEFTLYLVKLFGSAAPLLDLRHGDLLIDSGCGYAWTTEWFHKAGAQPIGVDICRTYLDIGIERMGSDRPHLVVADVEHLPIRAGVADAVFAFESAHHIPDRRKAMAGFGRALRPGGRMVLAEPGADHEHAKVSVDVMNKYGILEKGMELEDVAGYARGTQLGPPEQVFLLRVSPQDLGRTLDASFVRTHSVLDGNLFRLSRAESVGHAVAAAWRRPRRVIWPRVKRRMKAALVRLGLD